MTEKVSVITPTFGRQKFFPLLYECFAEQDYRDIELLVHDDSEQPSNYFDGRPDVRYFHSKERMSIGAKRNFLVDRAKGSIVAHFDDDDYYAPGYVSFMVDELGDRSMVKLAGWFIYQVEHQLFAYWDTLDRKPAATVQAKERPIARPTTESRDHVVRGYGFSYVYRKSTHGAARFPDQNQGEDYAWVKALGDEHPVHLVADVEGLALHILHGTNASRVFPQYLLPSRLLQRLFGAKARAYVMCRADMD
jgi:glycosyltransferase involved in cell wall biosynthesis